MCAEFQGRDKGTSNSQLVSQEVRKWEPENLELDSRLWNISYLGLDGSKTRAANQLQI